MKNDKIYFNGSKISSIGVEVELQIIDKKSFNLYPGAPVILNEFPGDIHIKEELLESIVEVNTKICKDISEVAPSLKEQIAKVIKVANKNDLEVVSIATHPFAKCIDQSVTKSDRYLNFVERVQFPLRRLLITGIHVHVGVESGEKAIAVTNGLVRYIPHMIAISASSPFFEGEETGLASTRTKIFEAMPTAGLPPHLTNYSEFQKFMRSLQQAGSIQSIREVWWDIRPHPGYGTVEIRAFDCVPDLKQMVRIAAFAQTLVVALSQHYDDGTQLGFLDRWINEENKWRAMRYGIDAQVIIDENGNQQPIIDSINELIDKLDDVSKEIETHGYLKEISNNIDRKNIPYKIQKTIYKESNNYQDIIKNNISILKNSIYD